MRHSKNNNVSVKVRLIYLCVGLSLIIILLVALYVLLRETDNIIVFFVLLIIISLGATVSLAYLPGEITFNNKNASDTSSSIKSKGSPAMFLSICSIGTAMYIWHINHPQYFGFTTYIRDINKQTVLRTGKLQIALGNSRPIEDIDGSGSVFFRDIPANFKNKLVQVELLDAANYQFTNGTNVDTLELSTQATTLVIEHNSLRCCLKGQVINKNGVPVVDVKVWTANFPPVNTDSLGRFNITIPNKYRMEEAFEVYAQKGSLRGYQRMNYVQSSTIDVK